MKIKIWGIYTQDYPGYKNEPQLISLWTNKIAALEMAATLKDDYVCVSEIFVNTEKLYDDNCEVIHVKQYD